MEWKTVVGGVWNGYGFGRKHEQLTHGPFRFRPTRGCTGGEMESREHFHRDIGIGILVNGEGW